MSAVSIIHAPRDAALSEKIAAALARAGHAARRVSADPAVGDLNDDEIDAGTAIVVWTEAAAKLARLHDQARQAMERGALIPVAVGGARPPGGFEALQPVDLSGWSGALDDPRWRFVLDEIEIAKQRRHLEDGAVWPDREPLAETGKTEEPAKAETGRPRQPSVPTEPKPASRARSAPLEDPFDEPEVAQGTLAAPLSNERLVPPRVRPPRRRFRSRDVAVGAAAGLVGMTIATAVMAPFALPGLSEIAPQSAPPADEVPDPSADAPSRLATLRPAERASSPPHETTGEEEIDPIEAAPLEEAPVSRAPQAVETASDDSATPDENAARAATEETKDEAKTETPEESAAPATEEFAPVDLALHDPPPEQTESAQTEPEQTETLPEPSSKQQELAAARQESGPDSDAMGNLLASLTTDGVDAAALLGVADSRPTVDRLPDELKDAAYLGNYFKECFSCPDMAALPGGSFRMGAPQEEAGARPSEGPAHTVTIDHRFAIGTREVTFDQWEACVADGGCRVYNPPDQGWGRGNRPVVGVSHEDAQAYTAWLSNKTGKNYRLPTEAEWEYAARAGKATAFAFGDSITSKRANFNGNYPYLGEKSAFRRQTTPVASFQPNPFGLFDMHGNVWEWTSDCWSETHEGAPEGGAARITGDCTRRVLKGGAWNTGAWRLRSAHRIGKYAHTREFDNGFRVARDLD